MYTQSHEVLQDDHYEDFRNTLGFLLPEEIERAGFQRQLGSYREELFRMAASGLDSPLAVKSQLKKSLRRVMVRTERLALRADRNGMLMDVLPGKMTLTTSDVGQYLGLQRVANCLGHEDVMEYWKSAPYLLNFMEDYDLKRKLRSAIESAEQNPNLTRALHSLRSGLLASEEVESYRHLDPGNSRLRALHEDTIGREAWRLLWVPPSLAYYQGS